MDDELRHWKYIKREKKNGKWIYTYPAKEAYEKAKAKYEELEKKASEANDDLLLTLDNYKKAKSSGQKNLGFESKLVESAKKKKDAASAAEWEARKEMNEVYKKTPEGAIANAVEKVWKKYDTLKDKLIKKIEKTADDTKKAAVDATTAATQKALSSLEKTEGLIDKTVDKAKKTFNELYDDPDNIYNVTPQSYDTKVAKIKETKEWKDIVARKDPEYVKQMSDGTTKYLIDDYIVHKKHPVLDAIGDVAYGRDIDFNEITIDTTVAGLKDSFFSSINAGILVTGVMAKVLTEKFKFSQGSYNDEINSVVDSVNRGAERVNKLTAKTTTVSDAQMKQITEMLDRAEGVRQVANAVDEGNVIAAAQMIANSQVIKDAVGSNEYYQMANEALSNLPEEDIMAAVLLLRELRKG